MVYPKIQLVSLINFTFLVEISERNFPNPVFVITATLSYFIRFGQVVLFFYFGKMYQAANIITFFIAVTIVFSNTFMEFGAFSRPTRISKFVEPKRSLKLNNL